MINRGLIIKKKFDASHFINNYQGGCAKMHGHTYNVEFYFNFADRSLNELNMLFDFKKIDGLLNEIIGRYDHECINGIAPYGTYIGSGESIESSFNTTKNPTAEYMAEVIYYAVNEYIVQELSLPANPLKEIVIWETDKYAATFGED
mgnify:FL=1